MNNFSFINPRIPFGDWVAAFIGWLQSTIQPVFDGISTAATDSYDGLEWILATPPYYLIIIIFAIIAWYASGWKLAVYTVIGFYLIRAFDVWEETMQSLALVIIGVVIALILSIPLGLWAAKVDIVSRIIKPVLDLMQTLSPLVYLVPVMVMFGIGTAPGAIATIVFALPPGARFTELAIRQVNVEVVEAGQAFGATPRGILGKIEIPLAMPTIMAGVNQVIMLALSMVVIAGMAGADGLGLIISSALQNTQLAPAVEAGTAVVIAAIFLDRVTAGLASHTAVAKLDKAAR